MGIAGRARRALFPLIERSFTYTRYDRFLARLAEQEATVVPLCEFAGASAAERPVVALRHDVDVSLESALELGRLEHVRGLRATYYMLHTAPYWTRPGLLDALRRLQDEYGHEIGWHNDLVTLQCVHGIDARRFLSDELARLRTAGIRVTGTASHGSSFCYRFGYHNNYFFSDFDGEVVPGFPNSRVVETARGTCEIERARLADFGLDYEAYHLDNNLYFSDTASVSGRRWHPDQLDVSTLMAGQKAIVLIHPCHWDRSVPAKLGRLAHLLAAGRWRGHGAAA
jgi:hypothetical protein